MQKEEFQKEGTTYIRETYDNGTIIEYIKPSEMLEEKPQPTPELPDASIALLEGLASVSEQLQKLEKRQTQMENNQIAVMEGLATMSEGKPNV